MEKRLIEMPSADGVHTFTELGYVSCYDAVLNCDYAFVAYKESERNGDWRVRINSSQTAGAVFEPALITSQARQTDAQGKSEFIWGYNFTPSDSDPREVAFRVQVERGQPTAIVITVQMRKHDHSKGERKQITVQWPETDKAAEKKLIEMPSVDGVHTFTELGYVSCYDAVLNCDYAFVAYKESERNGDWRVRINSSQTAGAVFEPALITSQARQTDAQGKSEFIWGYNFTPSDSDPREVAFRVQVERGQPTAIVITVQMRKHDHSKGERKQITVQWPETDKAAEKKLIEMPSADGVHTFTELGYVSCYDAVLNCDYAFVAYKESERNGDWRVRINSSQTAGAVFEPALITSQARQTDAQGKSEFIWGYNFTPSDSDPREVAFRVQVERGQPTAIVITVQMRKHDHSNGERKQITVQWPETDKAAEKKLIEMPSADGVHTFTELGYVSCYDAVLNCDYAFVAYKESERNGDWRVRINSSQTAGAVFEPALITSQARQTDAQGKSEFIWGYNFTPSDSDPREVAFRVQVERGQPTAIVITVQMRKHDHSKGERKQITVKWP